MINKFFNIVKRYFVSIFLLLLLLAANYYLLNSQFFKVHDYTHAARIAEMGRSLQDGAMPVRWSENFGFGFGMPLFNFYAPLPYYLGGLLWILGIDVVIVIKLLYFISSYLALLGGFKLGKKLFGNWGGLILGAAYLLSPYRAVNLFVRGALSEAWAMAFLPWVLYAAFTWIEKKDKKFLIILLFSLAGIILSHNLTALMFIPLAGLISFLYYLYLKNFSIKSAFKEILPIFSIYCLAVLLTAFYIIPAFMEKGFTQIDKIFSGYFHYSHHFLYIRQFFNSSWSYGGSEWGPNDGISFFLGYGQILGLGFLTIFFGTYLINIIKNKKLKKLKTDKKFFLALTFGLTSLFTLFMTLMKSKFLWDQIEVLPYIQFSWRWLSVATLMIAILAALSSSFIKKRFFRITYSFLLIIVIFFNSQFFKAENFLNNANDLYYTDEKNIQNEMSGILPDYIPNQMTDEKTLKNLNNSHDLLWEENHKNPMIINWSLTADRSHEKLIIINVKEETLINFKIAAFPGWAAEIDNEKIEILKNHDIGNIQILIPKGEHKISLYFSENTPYRLLGNSLTILALFILLYIFSPFKEKKRIKK